MDGNWIVKFVSEQKVFEVLIIGDSLKSARLQQVLKYLTSTEIL